MFSPCNQPITDHVLSENRFYLSPLARGAKDRYGNCVVPAALSSDWPVHSPARPPGPPAHPLPPTSPPWPPPAHLPPVRPPGSPSRPPGPRPPPRPPARVFAHPPARLAALSNAHPPPTPPTSAHFSGLASTCPWHPPACSPGVPPTLPSTCPPPTRDPQDLALLNRGSPSDTAPLQENNIQCKKATKRPVAMETHVSPSISSRRSIPSHLMAFCQVIASKSRRRRRLEVLHTGRVVCFVKGCVVICGNGANTLVGEEVFTPPQVANG